MPSSIEKHSNVVNIKMINLRQIIDLTGREYNVENYHYYYFIILSTYIIIKNYLYMQGPVETEYTQCFL